MSAGPLRRHFTTGGLIQLWAQARSAERIASIGPGSSDVLSLCLVLYFRGGRRRRSQLIHMFMRLCAGRPRRCFWPPAAVRGHAPPPPLQESAPVLLNSTARRRWLVLVRFARQQELIPSGPLQGCARARPLFCGWWDVILSWLIFQQLLAAARMRWRIARWAIRGAPALPEPGAVLRVAAGVRCRPALQAGAAARPELWGTGCEL